MANVGNISELRARLANVDKAIDAAMLGTSYSIGGRSVTRQDLASLREQRSHLFRELKATEATLQGATDGSTAIASWHGR